MYNAQKVKLIKNIFIIQQYFKNDFKLELAKIKSTNQQV